MYPITPKNFTVGWNTIFFHTRKQLYTLCLNNEPELSGTPRCNWTEIKGLPELLGDDDIALIGAGYGYTVLLTRSGNVFFTSKHHELGPCFPESSPTFTKLSAVNTFNAPDSEKVVQIVCGWRHILFLTESGSVFGAGSNAYGQLGLRYLPWALFEQILWIPPIKHIICGYDHTWLLTEDGTLLGAGSNVWGQLGLEDVIRRIQFLPIPGLDTLLAGDPIAQVVRGAKDTVLLTESGKLLVTGQSQYKDLTRGLPKQRDCIRSFIAVREQQSIVGHTKIVHIVNSAHQMWFLNERGKWFVAGDISDEQTFKYTGRGIDHRDIGDYDQRKRANAYSIDKLTNLYKRVENILGADKIDTIMMGCLQMDAPFTLLLTHSGRLLVSVCDYPFEAIGFLAPNVVPSSLLSHLYSIPDAESDFIENKFAFYLKIFQICRTRPEVFNRQVEHVEVVPRVLQNLLSLLGDKTILNPDQIYLFAQHVCWLKLQHLADQEASLRLPSVGQLFLKKIPRELIKNETRYWPILQVGELQKKPPMCLLTVKPTIWLCAETISDVNDLALSDNACQATRANLDKLPDDILNKLISYLSIADRLALAGVNQRLRSFLYSPRASSKLNLLPPTFIPSTLQTQLAQFNNRMLRLAGVTTLSELPQLQYLIDALRVIIGEEAAYTLKAIVLLGRLSLIALLDIYSALLKRALACQDDELRLEMVQIFNRV